MLINKFLLFQYSKAIFSLPTRAAILTLSENIDLLIVFPTRVHFCGKSFLTEKFAYGSFLLNKFLLYCFNPDETTRTKSNVSFIELNRTQSNLIERLGSIEFDNRTHKKLEQSNFDRVPDKVRWPKLAYIRLKMIIEVDHKMMFQ